MRKNKRFILLVVMVLLANCLFAGLASAATYHSMALGFSAIDAEFAYDLWEMNQFDQIRSSSYSAIGLAIIPGANGNFWNEGRDITVGYTWNGTETPNGIFKVSSDNTAVLTVGTAVVEDYEGEGAYTTLKPVAAGTATITIQAYAFEDWNYAYRTVEPHGRSVSFKVTIYEDTASDIYLVKKPTAKNYQVGATITAGLANTSTSATSLYFDLSKYTHDIEAFVMYKGTEYLGLGSGMGEWITVEVPVYGINSQGQIVQTGTTTKVTREYAPGLSVQTKFTAITWSASPAANAKITENADGSVTIEFLKAGSVTITAALKGDPRVKSSVSYTIDKNPDIPEETLKLQTADGKTSATVKLIKGETPATLTLSAKDAAGKAVEIYKFKSSNTKVATIDEKGIVTVKGEGTVQLSGVKKDGTTYYFNLKVKKVPVNKLTVEKKSLTVEAGKTAQIAWATKPAYAYNPAVKFTSSDKKVATVSATGLVTGVKAGKTTVVVTPKFAKDTVNPVTIKVTVK